MGEQRDLQWLGGKTERSWMHWMSTVLEQSYLNEFKASQFVLLIGRW